MLLYIGDFMCLCIFEIYVHLHPIKYGTFFRDQNGKIFNDYIHISMKKIAFLILTVCITLFSVRTAQAQTLTELKTLVDAIASECPTGNGDLDIFSATIDDNYVVLSFYLTENPKDDSFTIKRLKKDKSFTDLLQTILTLQFLDNEETAPLITGCASNQRGLKYTFRSLKTKKEYTMTTSNEELQKIVSDFEKPTEE